MIKKMFYIILATFCIVCSFITLNVLPVSAVSVDTQTRISINNTSLYLLTANNSSLNYHYFDFTNNALLVGGDTYSFSNFVDYCNKSGYTAKYYFYVFNTDYSSVNSSGISDGYDYFLFGFDTLPTFTSYGTSGYTINNPKFVLNSRRYNAYISTGQVLSYTSYYFDKSLSLLSYTNYMFGSGNGSSNSNVFSSFYSNFDPHLPDINLNKSDVDCSITSDDSQVTFSITNNTDYRINYLAYISDVNNTDLNNSFRNYCWAYTTYDKRMISHIPLSSLSSTLANKITSGVSLPSNTFVTDLWGNVIDLGQDLLYLYDNNNDTMVCSYDSLSSPFQSLVSGQTKTITVPKNDLKMVSDCSYTGYIAWRLTSYNGSSIHFSGSGGTHGGGGATIDDATKTYSNDTFVDSDLTSYSLGASQLINNYSLDDDYVFSDPTNQPGYDPTKSNGSYGYTDVVNNIKGSSSYSGGGAGGSASVINNNNPTFNNNPSININTGGSSSGSGGAAQEFDDVDVTTFNNLWNSATGFFDFVKKVLTLFPLQTTFVTSIFVVLLVLRIARR